MERGGAREREDQPGVSSAGGGPACSGASLHVRSSGEVPVLFRAGAEVHSPRGAGVGTRNTLGSTVDKPARVPARAAALSSFSHLYGDPGSPSHSRKPALSRDSASGLRGRPFDVEVPLGMAYEGVPELLSHYGGRGVLVSAPARPLRHSAASPSTRALAVRAMEANATSSFASLRENARLGNGIQPPLGREVPCAPSRRRTVSGAPSSISEAPLEGPRAEAPADAPAAAAPPAAAPTAAPKNAPPTKKKSLLQSLKGMLSGRRRKDSL